MPPQPSVAKPAETTGPAPESRKILVALIRGLKFTVALLEKVLRGDPI